jgi:hypothetical protein
MTGLATPGNGNTPRSRVPVFNDLRVFPEEANSIASGLVSTGYVSA